MMISTSTTIKTRKLIHTYQKLLTFWCQAWLILLTRIIKTVSKKFLKRSFSAIDTTKSMTLWLNLPDTWWVLCATQCTSTVSRLKTDFFQCRNFLFCLSFMHEIWTPKALLMKNGVKPNLELNKKCARSR